MDEFSGVLERANLECFRDFLLDGDGGCIEQCAYEKTLREIRDPLIKELRKTYHTIESYESIESLLIRMLTNYQNIFFDIGMKAGATLQRELWA